MANLIWCLTVVTRDLFGACKIDTVGFVLDNISRH